MKPNLLHAGLVTCVLAAWALGGCHATDDTPIEAERGPTAKTAPHSPKDNKDAPRIVAVEPNHNFGKVRQGKDATHVFKLRNEGRSDLIIERAKGS
jgi:hypothetical protein